MAISVIIGTFGDGSWKRLADTAAASIAAQTVAPLELIRHHGTTLANARNGGAALAKGEWLCFLDADDTLDPAYIAAMLAAIPSGNPQTLFQPAVQYIHTDKTAEPPRVLPATNLFELNYLIIGTLISRQFFTQVGGFGEWAYAEDWELWLRCHLRGAAVQPVPAAAYVANVNPAGRNIQNAQATQTYQQIRSLHAVAWAHKAKYG